MIGNFGSRNGNEQLYPTLLKRRAAKKQADIPDEVRHGDDV